MSGIDQTLQNIHEFASDHHDSLREVQGEASHDREVEEMQRLIVSLVFANEIRTGSRTPSSGRRTFL
ncbi:hypothetical protein GPL17_36875 [Bradyrhizobium yuanmingense]|uniref:hypothetical protein n=1 Tax=Bradyrhizobium yuanmingense TaxID=108015 RepID=UPI0012FC6987|nr:hypothetical protein [Bradyrhizobium yuanmingense]MVT55953.1 hypothetical protein [Bradyrhizobium yuanmingense]